MSLRTTDAPTSYVWVWKENACVDDTNPICLKAGQEFANRMGEFASPEWFVVDQLGYCYRVVERRFIGHETVSVERPSWVEFRGTE